MMPAKHKGGAQLHKCTRVNPYFGEEIEESFSLTEKIKENQIVCISFSKTYVTVVILLSLSIPGYFWD